MAPLILTLVRHGESVDNCTALWAGHRDAPLTNHGFNQSLRLGQAFSDVPITAIYTSDLKRAHTTAKNVFEANKSEPKPPFVVSPLLREQLFGDAEGEPWDAGAFSSSHLPWEDHRAFQIANLAESLNEVAERATNVLRHFILPHIVSSSFLPEGQGEHVVLFAHGIFLSEMLFSIQRTSDPNARFIKRGGYTNTGWSRLELSLKEPLPKALEKIPYEPPHIPLSPYVAHPLASPLPALPPTRHEALPPHLPNDAPLPPLAYKVIAMDQTQHLVGLVKQKGGIGSMANGQESGQRKLQEFFGGGGGTGGGAGGSTGEA